MRMRTVEISVGGFLLAGIVSLIFIAVDVSGVSLSRAEGTYPLKARFDDVAGLRVRSKVSMAGVTIGRVAAIDVDSEYGEAVVTLEIDRKIANLTKDAGAQIQTEGILGGRYVSISQGADEEFLKAGDYITNTQGAVVLENLIGDFLSRGGESK
jgi:phospholipid/cholesterol/gamma-HCH transport system substrate-binding protein